MLNLIVAGAIVLAAAGFYALAYKGFIQNPDGTLQCRDNGKVVKA